MCIDEKTSAIHAYRDSIRTSVDATETVKTPMFIADDVPQSTNSIPEANLAVSIEQQFSFESPVKDQGDRQSELQLKPTLLSVDDEQEKQSNLRVDEQEQEEEEQGEEEEDEQQDDDQEDDQKDEWTDHQEVRQSMDPGDITKLIFERAVGQESAPQITLSMPNAYEMKDPIVLMLKHAQVEFTQQTSFDEENDFPTVTVG